MRSGSSMKINIKNLKFVILLIPAIIIFLGCPGAKKDKLMFYRNQVDSLRNLVNSFVIEYNQLKMNSYLNNEPFLVSKLYHKYGELFNKDDINLINELLKLEQRPERIDRLERLKYFIYEKLVEKYTVGIHDKIELTKFRISYSSSKHNLETLDELFANEQNSKKREIIYNSFANQLSEIQRLNLSLFSERKAYIIDSLGFNSYEQFASMIRQEDLSKFYNTINDFISTTNDYYYQLLYEILRTKNFSQNKLKNCDIPFLLNDSRIEKLFKSDSLLSIYLNTFHNIGIKVDSLPNLKLDILPTKKTKSLSKYPIKTRGFEIRIPDENYLLIYPTGGSQSYEKLFSETGKLIPSIFSTESEFEFNYFGGDIIPLTFKFALGNLLDEELFLKTEIFHSARFISDYFKLRAFSKLYYARKLCADYLVESKLFDSMEIQPDSLLQIYSSILGYNITYGDRLRLFMSLNDFLYETDILKSLFIEAMMKTRIKEKYGKMWFTVPDVKNHLSKFVERGRFLTKDKFLIEIGYYDLDPRFYFNNIISLVEKSKTLKQR